MFSTEKLNTDSSQLDVRREEKKTRIFSKPFLPIVSFVKRDPPVIEQK